MRGSSVSPMERWLRSYGAPSVLPSTKYCRISGLRARQGKEHTCRTDGDKETVTGGGAGASQSPGRQIGKSDDA